MVVEVVVYNIESAIMAQQGGANRVEVCTNPDEGGTTPSLGTIELVRQHLNIDVYVMIRPRGGDFLYSIEEYHAMRKDIEACKKLSVDGVVFGVLNSDGTLDKEKCKKLIAQARPLRVTCHRAFDMTPDPYQALEDCIEAGFDRILTSGQHEKAIQGVDIISELVIRARGRIIIMPGSGVNEDTVTEIITKTQAKEIHFSAVAHRLSAMTYHQTKITGMSINECSEFKIRTVDPERIKTTRKLAEAALIR